MTAPTFPADTAACIREHVLPPAKRDTSPLLCPCEWGPCGRCAGGDHHLCRSTRPVVYPATWITNATGTVMSPAPSEDVQVWRVGRPCSWRCSCDCRTEPEPKLTPVQDSLFEVTA